ncbi:unnamed protein product [Rotaria sp. Silwood1]|nr:unnamed protein product [Rotaria sp. Silwood1]CAF3918021.1 unnamed protein product [Rotaria sp. Silwood1]
MDYPAPTNNLYQVEKPLSIWEKINVIREFLGHMYGIFVDLPLMIMDKLGLPVNFFQINPALCSICICGSIVGMTSSVGIGLGVGLGVGLHCVKSENVIVNTTNTTSTG